VFDPERDGYCRRCTGRVMFTPAAPVAGPINEGGSMTPDCCYCGNPLTSSDFDDESRTYFASHMACGRTNPLGQYAVVTCDELSMTTDRAEDWPRYTTSRRAQVEAEHLAAWNSGRWSFKVTDLLANVILAEYAGRRQGMAGVTTTKREGTAA